MPVFFARNEILLFSAKKYLFNLHIFVNRNDDEVVTVDVGLGYGIVNIRRKKG